MQVISLGAGVQSTTMALMAARGELEPMPHCAIFADTGWEPAATYKHLRELMTLVPFPVHVVSAGNLRSDLFRRQSKRARQFVPIPAFLRNGLRHGLGRRECTTHYKIEPIARKLRELLGKRPRARISGTPVTLWIGISVDEIFRATPSKIVWQQKRFPLIEARMHRRDCVAWLERHGYQVPPKSACIGCPFHDDDYWRDMRANRPAEWRDTIAVDYAIRRLTTGAGEQFLHSQRVPLDQVDLSTARDYGQLDLFNNECQGLCGV